MTTDIEVVQTIPWTSEIPNIKNPVANTGHQYLKFINTHIFSYEARHFLKYGYYTNAPVGSQDYDAYWDEQEDRCYNGYSVGGVRITGRHYFTLNFGRIKARPIDPYTGLERENGKKIITFPRFLDHQYYLFHELEECFAEGPHVGKALLGLVILKSRRKGATYAISSGVLGYNYNFVEASNNILAAYEKQHYKTTLDAVHLTLNHLNKCTDWSKRRDKLDKREHLRASFVYKNDLGHDIEDGFMSEIQAISFKDNPFKSIGESISVLAFEEAGRFSGLLNAYGIAEPTLRDGDIFTGIPIVYGTGGDMGAGSSDLATIFFDPATYGFKAYENIYEENSTGDCGWFIDDMWYYPGTYNDGVKTHILVDKDGNSYRDLAEKSLDHKRVVKSKGSKQSYNLFISQQPKTPSEALLQTTDSPFDVVTAKNVLAQIMANAKKYIHIRIGHFDINLESSKPYFVESNTDVPCLEFPIRDNKNKKGAVILFSVPVRSPEGDIAPTRYIAAIDPYDDDESNTKSLGSMLVLDLFTDRIVAHYKGRPDANTFYETCRRLGLYYNAKIIYERNKKGLYGYFYNKAALYMLADEPEILREKGISSANTSGNSSKGIYGSGPVNAWGIELYALWCGLQAYGEEEGSPITNLHRVESIPLLRETIHFNISRGNFDDISAVGLLMIFRESLKIYRTPSKPEKKENMDKYLKKWQGHQRAKTMGMIGSSRFAIQRSKLN